MQGNRKHVFEVKSRHPKTPQKLQMHAFPHFSAIFLSSPSKLLKEFSQAHNRTFIPLQKSISGSIPLVPLSRPSLLTAITTLFSSMDESVGSNSPPPSNHRFHPRFKPTDQPVADRIVRALHHHLRLLHRSDANFYVLGATGNVYTVMLSTAPSCNCPDRTNPCKHILFVFLRVLGISMNDICLRRRTLRPCQVTRLLRTPTSPQTVAGVRARERFHQLFSQSTVYPPPRIELRNDAMCPVCLEEMNDEGKAVECRACGNALHKECLKMWKRSKGRSVNCVMCRARWRERAEQDRYLNLSAYVSEEDMVEGGSLCGV